MGATTTIFRSTFPVPRDELWAWHVRPGAFERLTPPWQEIRDFTRSGPLAPGSTARFRTRIGGVPWEWVARHEQVDPPRLFRDVQWRGPFRRFDHRHLFHDRGPGASELEDRIEWELPGGALSSPMRAFALRELRRAFAYRHRLLARDLAIHAGSTPMKLLVTGSHGLVGSALVPFLTTAGHSVRRLVRGDGEEGDANWKPEADEIDARALDDVDAVIHLAGDGIADGRWNADKKQRIRDSRVKGTHLLATRIAAAAKRPAAFVCASAIGYYGDRGDGWLDEGSALGAGFLADVCREWETATHPASEAGVRVVNTRFGFILSARGGGLRRMLPPFRMGVGGRLGNGKQWISWVALDDVLAALLHAARTATLSGPVNVVAPQPVTNAEFTRTLGRVLQRPTLLPMPAFAARAAFGETADEVLLCSQRVKAAKLVASGFSFGWPTLEEALRHTLGEVHPAPEPASGAAAH
jgi:uncharacterized protein (TIGR01777 family)